MSSSVLIENMATDIYQQADNGLSDLFGDEEFDAMEDQEMESFEAPVQLGNSAEQDEENDELAEIMRGSGLEGMNWNDIGSMSLESDVKADDAQDYEDIGDDDSLPDEELSNGMLNQSSDQVLPGIADSTMDDVDFEDDLFGPSSPNEHTFEPQRTDGSTQQISHLEQDPDLASDHEDDDTQMLDDLEPEISEEDMAQWRIQQQLFAQSGKGFAPTTMDENVDEWLKLEFPDFKRDEIPFWTKLLPPKPQRYPFKAPTKPPKPVRPSKVNLEIVLDQKALFTSSAVAANAYELQHGLVPVELVKLEHDTEPENDESDTEEALPGGIMMQDLNLICTDFDTLSHGDFSDSGVADMDSRAQSQDQEDDLFGSKDFPDSGRPIKKRRLGLEPSNIVSIQQLDMPSFDDPEQLTAKLAQQVILDLNDSALLLEEVDGDTSLTRIKPGEKMLGAKTTKDRLKNRFKTSNDAEYDLLKQNHQQKIRGLLGHMSIDHSLPAVRLQYPYYKVKLPISELRNYHRKRITFKQPITFSKLAKIKKKERKGKPTKELYVTTKDLSFGDNSSALLLEYSEEHPVMLSQIGMGNKVVNYYRRRTGDDTSRPKGEIGETNVLLPEDKSPFHAFGPIDPGEAVMALYNSMYRAPIFEHPNKPQDFLVIRETTGQGGSQHYIRNVDHTYVVGQELPSVTVPGTHSRMVTTASKNRLKAISFRVARRKKSNRIRVEEVTRHFPDTTDMQNRQKMKEFMVFSKEHKEWEMRAGEAIPDEAGIQQLIKPEDICLLESMQVGHQYLQDAGYADRDEEEDDDGKDNETDSIEQQLAPWKTTKNFLQATQGKAMLKLYGEGDPSGRGEAFSFIKTSMKGGFKAVGGSVQDTLSMKKELGGHSYNVARQQKSYEESIRGIWDKQKANLSSTIEPSDFDDDGVDGQIDEYSRNGDVRATPMSSTPVTSRRRDDDTATSFSKRSFNSQAQRYLKIVRTAYIDGEYIEQPEIISDPLVIKQYLKIKEDEEAQSVSVTELAPTGDPEYDARQQKRIREQLARLEKAKARRNQREKTKAALNAASPSAASPDGEASTPGGRQVQATQRKCANCGQVGHIKTNKKSVSTISSKCRSCHLPFDRKIGGTLMEAPEFG